MDYLKRTWCEINLDSLRENIRQLKQIAKKELIGVVKADAYGHGEKEVTRILKEEGISFFAVSNINEAINLRHLGISEKILILGYTPPELADLLVKHQIIQTVHDVDYAAALNRFVSDGKVAVHLKIDTGMGRLGFPPTEASVERIMELAPLEKLNICGIFTHFSCSDSFDPEDEAFTRKQMEGLDRMVEELKERGLSFEAVHAQNSAGITNYQNDGYNFARAGILMYGLNPSEDVKGDIRVKPLLSWKTVITMVKEVPAGTYISYGRTYQTEKPTKIATLAVGYADGYYRSLSSKAEVLVGGKRCKILGRVCMDQMMIDVTEVPQVKIGDVATLIGKDQDEEITADELAKIAGTINYEVVCSISKRVPRVYFENGKETGAIDYSLH